MLQSMGSQSWTQLSNWTATTGSILSLIHHSDTVVSTERKVLCVRSCVSVTGLPRRLCACSQVSILSSLQFSTCLFTSIHTEFSPVLRWPLECRVWVSAPGKQEVGCEDPDCLMSCLGWNGQLELPADPTPSWKGHLGAQLHVHHPGWGKRNSGWSSHWGSNWGAWCGGRLTEWGERV